MEAKQARSDTTLSFDQHQALDRFAAEYPESRSVSWLESPRRRGPVVRESDMLSTHFVVTAGGRRVRVGRKLIEQVYEQRKVWEI